MTASSSRRRQGRTLAIGVASLGLLGAAIAPTFAATGSHQTATKHVSPTVKTAKAKSASKAVVAGSRYLALGDSVSFGYRESNAIPAPNYTKASNLVGFPEDVATNLGLKLANAACPGETTASFLKVTGVSNGCENTPASSSGYRTAYPLHVKYSSAKESQMQYAEAYLKAHPKTKLVTLMIGANDGYVCQETTSDQCTSTAEFSAVINQINKNATKIFKGLRDTAGYKGQIVVVTYYSTDYSNSVDNAQSIAVSSAVRSAGKPFHIETANGYVQFKKASRQVKGVTCTAGLLTVLSTTPSSCGVHTSPAGAALLAQAVERAIKK